MRSGFFSGFVAVLALLILAPLAFAEGLEESPYFRIDSVTMEEVSMDQLEDQELFEQFHFSRNPRTPFPSAPAPSGPGGAGFPDPFSGGPSAPVTGMDNPGAVAVTINAVVNAAKAVWDLVVSNKFVVNVNSDHANAVPQGIDSWTSLSNWQMPKGKAYRVVYRNGYGGTVVDFTFRVLFVPGGQYRGKGAFISNATIVPSTLKVSWGYTFNANAKVTGVTNAGTDENPVAAMQLDMNWVVETILKHEQHTQNFYIRGDGFIANVSDGSILTEVK